MQFINVLNQHVVHLKPAQCINCISVKLREREFPHNLHLDFIHVNTLCYINLKHTQLLWSFVASAYQYIKTGGIILSQLPKITLPGDFEVLSYSLRLAKCYYVNFLVRTT